jgi:hypothetical protein
MNAFDPQLAADAAREAYRKTMAQFDLALEAPVPENVRAIAEKALTETRDVYERAKDRLESDLETLERTIDAAGQGATTLNRKIIDIAQRNVNSGFELAKSLTGVRRASEMVEVHVGYWRSQPNILAKQAEELTTLSKAVLADVLEPVKIRVSATA